MDSKKTKILSKSNHVNNRSDRIRPILYLPESITSSSVQRPITNPIVGNYITFPLRFIYNPTIIDGLPQPPPLITGLGPYLKFYHITGMSYSSLRIFKNSR